ncbi:hypothetical protein [Streptomyces sp. 4F14]|uniref:hypothetical protein n=1 Tax=Streptomyces sp. 4F14 TaxID=3394380 RepID=UPI003A893CFE
MASTGTQAPFCLTRVGSRLPVQVTVPDGLACAVEVSVVSASTVTGLPLADAFAWAAASADS